jgi:redox-sensitive bicupin YhaK (pirin superfamily)
VFKPGDTITIKALTDARFMMVLAASRWIPSATSGGTLSLPRKRSIEQAKEDWKRKGRFDIVPGDEAEFIPLPD